MRGGSRTEDVPQPPTNITEDVRDSVHYVPVKPISEAEKHASTRTQHLRNQKTVPGTSGSGENGKVKRPRGVSLRGSARGKQGRVEAGQVIVRGRKRSEKKLCRVMRKPRRAAVSGSGERGRLPAAIGAPRARTGMLRRKEKMLKPSA